MHVSQIRAETSIELPVLETVMFVANQSSSPAVRHILSLRVSTSVSFHKRLDIDKMTWVVKVVRSIKKHGWRAGRESTSKCPEASRNPPGNLSECFCRMSHDGVTAVGPSLAVCRNTFRKSYPEEAVNACRGRLAQVVDSRGSRVRKSLKIVVGEATAPLLPAAPVARSGACRTKSRPICQSSASHQYLQRQWRDSCSRRMSKKLVAVGNKRKRPRTCSTSKREKESTPSLFRKESAIAFCVQ